MTLRQYVSALALLVFGLFPTTTDAQISIGYPGGYGGVRDISAPVRLQVTPKDADVFVDGFYAGKVDDFDGAFQRLRVEPGEHEIQVFLPGHRLYSQQVYLQPGNTFNVRHTMERLGPGEPEPDRPTGTARPSSPGRPLPGVPSRPAPDSVQRDGAGAVVIRVLPADAVIMIDGERWDGERDERLTVQLSAGPHTVEVRKAGYRGYLTEVRVEPGQTVPLNISLSPE